MEIKDRIDEYLEFDSSELFQILIDPTGGVLHDPLVRIFGGAIRDIIAGEPKIHDIDILSGAHSRKYLDENLTKHGYTFMESLISKDISSIYSDIHVINEPHTWIKGTKIVQVIRPVIKVDYNPLDPRGKAVYEEGFKDLISNVDISCCGLSWDGRTLYENYPDAITHCLSKSFVVNSGAKMYSTRRISHRKAKMEDRGWEDISSVGNRKESERNLKLNAIINTDLSFDRVRKVIKQRLISYQELA